MTQDFAKIKAEPILDRKPPVSQPTWSFLLTGMILGLVVGVFGCFLFYLSGSVPPLPQSAEAAAVIEEPTPEPAQQLSNEIDPQPLDQDAEPGLELEFYQELPNYEVEVDTNPVEIAQNQSEPEPTIIAAQQQTQTPPPTRYMLQSGAFQQRESAQYQKSRLQNLGMATTIKEQTLPGRTLYLVQSGPYLSRAQVSQAEQVLRDNSITSMRISLN